MATLTVDRRFGKVAAHKNEHSNIQWRKHRCRHTIRLSSQTYRRKTVERFEDLAETQVYDRKNGTHVPDNAAAN